MMQVTIARAITTPLVKTARTIADKSTNRFHRKLYQLTESLLSPLRRLEVASGEEQLIFTLEL